MSRCRTVAMRGDRIYRCENREGHVGNCEATDGGRAPSRTDLLVPTSEEHRRAYLLGAINFASGGSLDSLALRCGTERKAKETDGALSARLRAKMVAP